MIDEKRIAEIRERYKAATPGPWYIPLSGNYIESERGRLIYVFGFEEQANVDIRFVAQSREDIPYLLEEIESLQAQLAEETSRRYQAECNYDHAVADRDSLQTQLVESRRREQAAVDDLKYYPKCRFCKHNDRRDTDFVRCTSVPCNYGEKWEWRDPQAAECEIAEYVENCSDCGFCKDKAGDRP